MTTWRPCSIASERVGDAGGRVSGRLDDDVERVAGDQPAVHRPSRAFPAPSQPARRERGTGAIGREVGHARELEPAQPPGLRQEHRSELAGADQREAKRVAGGGPFLEQVERRCSIGRSWAARGLSCAGGATRHYAQSSVTVSQKARPAKRP